MSYSRWGKNSHWYTYWHAGCGYDRDNQYFDVCGVQGFTYKNLKNDIEGCLAKVKEEDPSATKKELKELMGYMQEFIFDVEHSKDLNFYEDLKEARISPELLEWYEQLEEDKFGSVYKSLIKEALDVLYAPDNKLPLLIGVIKADIGILLLEKRLRGVVKQLVVQSVK
jgi:hypothetical protein